MDNSLLGGKIRKLIVNRNEFNTFVKARIEINDVEELVLMERGLILMQQEEKQSMEFWKNEDSKHYEESKKRYKKITEMLEMFEHKNETKW